MQCAARKLPASSLQHLCRSSSEANVAPIVVDTSGAFVEHAVLRVCCVVLQRLAKPSKGIAEATQFCHRAPALNAPVAAMSGR